MVIQRVNREAAERIFIVMQANESGIAADDVVALETTAASVDGVKVVQPATALQAAHGVVGVADAAIAQNAYGLVQVYGYRSTSRIVTTDSSYALNIALRAASGQDYFSTQASTVGVVPPAVLLETHTTSTGTVSKKVFLRMM
ncbi:MAG TPA: hypothetical protein VEA38_00985 [Terriglobales bacterium]|nr:hypothetical protein [Terriglobales bacterium]